MRKEVDYFFPGATGLTSFLRRLLLVRTISVTSAKTICKLAPGKVEVLEAHKCRKAGMFGFRETLKGL